MDTVSLPNLGSVREKLEEANTHNRYTIGQRIAKTFSQKNRIFLCGDAAHTHSSGAAQGLNTGIHDAINLGWKLALQIRDLASPDVLGTYSTERTSAVQKLIDYDRDISILMSHKWPEWYKGDPHADPYIVLGHIFEQAASFNTGLGISYPENLVNQPCSIALHIVPGSRPPDMELTMPGTNQAIRLQRITRNTAKFWILVFTGSVSSTKPELLELQNFWGSAKALTTHEAVGWITISPTVGCSPYEAIGMRPFGDTYYDATNGAHEKMGIHLAKGGMIILRPDGLIGSGGSLDGRWVLDYVSRVVKL